MNEEEHPQEDVPVTPSEETPVVIESTEPINTDEETSAPEEPVVEEQTTVPEAEAPNADVSAFFSLLEALSLDLRKSFAETQTQIDAVLSERTKTIDSLVNFTRAQLDVNARDNLRIERMKSIYKLIWGNLQFVQESLVERPDDSILPRLQRRLTYLSQEFHKVLQEDGVRVIAPVRNESVNANEHCIEREVACVNEDDIPGHIAQTCTIGFDIQGRITPAEVFIYASSPESTNQ